MGKIQVLDRSTADLIAAGEVVERPASVVKELVENSIDAGATAITVEIREGGVSYIRVSDNGAGMEREDAHTAFLRHATSKIRCGEDLFNIGTLGFRGEALAAISAVSKVELITRTAESAEGIDLRLEAGEIAEESSIGCPVGTTLLVEQLFFNTPARMKFLKKNTTEGAAVASVLDKLAIVNPDVSFTFLKDGRRELFTPGNGDLRAAVYAVFGRDAASDLLPLSYEGEGITITGFLGRPENCRPNRNFQNFFVNGRNIRSKVMTAALDDGCKSYVEREKHLFCVLLLDLNGNLVDVNVHPAKMEVKFSNERQIYSAVYFAVRSALEKIEDFARSAGERAASEELPQPEPAGQPAEAQPQICEMPPPLRQETVWTQEPPAPSRSFLNRVSLDIFPTVDESSTLPQPTLELRQDPEAWEAPGPAPEPEAVEEQKITMVGQLFDTYLIVQLGDEAVFIDKHAAQERIIYERIKSQKDGQNHAQELLAPVVVELSKEEQAALAEHGEFLVSLGFVLDDFGGGSVAVRAVPMNAGGDVAELVRTVASVLQSGRRDVRSQLYDRVMYSIACKAAIKGGQKNSPEELRYLAEEVLAMPDIRYCPHGRPVAVFMTKAAFERQFGR